MGNPDLVIDCLRHGACEGPSCLRGHSDVNLSEKGVRQFHRVAEVLTPPDAIVSSPLRRCKEGAEILSRHFACEYSTLAELAEMNFGAWDGVPLQQLHDTVPRELGQFWEDPYRFPPPHSEPLADFTARCERAWQHLLTSPHQHLLVVAHAGVIKAFIAARLGIERITTDYLSTLPIGYASLVRFRTSLAAEEPKRWTRLEFLGDPAGLDRGNRRQQSDLPQGHHS